MFTFQLGTNTGTLPTATAPGTAHPKPQRFGIDVNTKAGLGAIESPSGGKRCKSAGHKDQFKE
ncbi:unnamed protein product [Mucor fragilis]